MKHKDIFVLLVAISFLEDGDKLKTCICCKQTKHGNEFYKDATQKDGLGKYCKECFKEKQKIYYERNKKMIMENRKDYHRARRRVMQDFANSFKTPCAKCGESRMWLIDYHHKDPSLKSFTIGSSANGHSKKTIIAEIDKCVCLCRNCHTDFHYLYGNVPENPVESLKEYLGVE